jgi:hypothetical protein
MGRAILTDTEELVGRALGTTYHRSNATEPYVCIPPALIITDSNGATWTLGFDYLEKGWRYYFSVLRNDIKTGEYAEKIEYRRGKVRIWTQDGWKVWTERKRKNFAAAPGYFI